MQLSLSKLVLVSILFLFLFSSFSSFISADEVTDTPFPQFNLIFNEFDAPVTIISAELVSDEYSVPVPYIANLDQYLFTFSTNVYLLNGEYSLRVLAEDKDGNTQLYEDTIDVNADIMDIWISNPLHPDYKTKFQDSAIRTSVPFNFTMKTEYDTTCRIRKNVGSLTNIPSLYENFMLTSFNEGSSTPTKTHNLHVALQGTANSFPPNSFVTVSEPFQNSNYDARDSFLVVCKQETAGGSPVYHPKIFYIGYDEENSGFEAYFTPQLIEDTAALRTNLHIQSNEDLQSCHYEFIDNPSPSYSSNYGPVSLAYKAEAIRDFNTVYDKEFSFQTQLLDFDIGEQKDYAVNITCYDMAYEPVSHMAYFSVNLTTVFDITLPQSHFADKKPTLEFDTSLKAFCMYEFDYANDPTYADMIGDGTLQLNHPLELPVKVAEDGIYEIKLFCTADSDESKTFQFTIDTIAPSSPVISGNDFYCDDGLGLNILAPINDTVQYNITLYNGSSTSGEKLLDGFMSSFTSDNFTFSLPSNIQTDINSTYTWSVIALDQGGLTSGTPVTKTVTILNPSSLECDINSPFGSVEVKKVIEGFSFNVSCIDLESGCSATFKYGIVENGVDCSTTVLTLGSYGQPLTSFNDGTLCYSVYDLAGNEFNATKKLSSSVPADVDVTSPKFGIANEKDFLFSVNTNKELTCKFGPNTATPPSDVGVWYDSLESFSFTGGIQHSTQITTSNYPSFDTTQPEQTIPWVVICSDGTQYFKKELTEFGYDVTDPQLTISISPNPVTDSQNQEITINVNADDEVVCTYTDDEGVSRGFNNYDPNERTSYASSHTISMSYYGFNNNDIVQKIKCRNVAQSVNEKEEIVHVQPENNAEITLESTYSKITNFDLEVKTTTDANCVYQLNNAGSFQNFQSTGQTTHKKILSLTDGRTPIQIQCTSGTGVSTYYDELIVDSEKPTIKILAPSTTCSSTELKATFIASGTGSPIENYDYTLTNSLGEIIKTGLISDNELSITEGLVLGESVTLSVTARDKAGNSKEASKKIIIGNGNCDSLAPSATVKNALSWEKTLTTLSCKDNQNDCTNYFSYYLDDTGSCQESQNSELYSNQPLEIIKPITLCYTVYDEDNNKFSSSEFIQVHLQCFNGIEDPDEQGVDCGGPCAATCGLCDNGVQDPFEEGVDCGNVCQTINTCKEDSLIPVVQDKECEADTDCKSDYYCSFRGQCVKESKPNTGQNYYDDKGNDTNIVGLILLILGLLFMGAGIGYIYYSQNKKLQAMAQVQASQSQQQSQYMSAQQKVRAAQIAKQQREAAKRKAELLAQQKAKQSELEGERIAERKNKRSSLLGAFGSSDDSKKNIKSDEKPTEKSDSSTKKKEIFTKVKITEQPDTKTKTTISQTKKADISATASADGYVALGDLSGKNSYKKQSSKKTSDSEDALSKLAHMKDATGVDSKSSVKDKILFSEKTNPSQIRNKGANLDDVKEQKDSSKKSSVSPKKHSVFDDIDSLAQKSNLSSDPNEDYFKTLENTVQAAHGKSNDEIIESLATTIGNIQGKLDSKDFLEKFSNSALTKQLNNKTTKDLIALLVKEKKITAKDAKIILEKLIGDKK